MSKAKDIASKLIRSTKPKIADDKCPFRFTVKYHVGYKQYYLFKEGCGCNRHSGHLRLKSTEVMSSSKLLSDEELKEVYDQLNHMVSPEVVKALILSKTNLKFSTSQIQYIEKMRRNIICDDKSNPSPASKLIHYLENNPNIVYTELIAGVGNENLISIRQKRSGKKSRTITNNSFIGDSNDESMDSFAQRGT